MDALKPGVLLEVGFDDVTPNTAKDISSWLYDYAADKVDIIEINPLVPAEAGTQFWIPAFAGMSGTSSFPYASLPLPGGRSSAPARTSGNDSPP